MYRCLDVYNAQYHTCNVKWYMHTHAFIIWWLCTGLYGQVFPKTSEMCWGYPMYLNHALHQIQKSHAIAILTQQKTGPNFGNLEISESFNEEISNGQWTPPKHLTFPALRWLVGSWRPRNFYEKGWGFFDLGKMPPISPKNDPSWWWQEAFRLKNSFVFLLKICCLDLVDIFFGGIGGIWLVNLRWTLKNPRILMGEPSRRSSQKTPTSGPEIWRDESVWSDVTLIFFTAL